MKEQYSNFRSAKIIEVIKVEVNEGEGIIGDPIKGIIGDPVRRVAYLVSKTTGKVLAKIGEEVERKFSNGNDEMIEV